MEENAEMIAMNSGNDLSLLAVGEGSMDIRISGATFRNLKRFADFLKAHDMEGGAGPWGRALDLRACLYLAGEGFLGEEARGMATEELHSWFDNGERMDELREGLREVAFEEGEARP